MKPLLEQIIDEFEEKCVVKEPIPSYFEPGKSYAFRRKLASEDELKSFIIEAYKAGQESMKECVPEQKPNCGVTECDCNDEISRTEILKRMDEKMK